MPLPSKQIVNQIHVTIRVSILKMDLNKANVSHVRNILGLRTLAPGVEQMSVIRMGQRRSIQMVHVKNAHLTQGLNLIQASLMLLPKSCVKAILVNKLIPMSKLMGLVRIVAIMTISKF